MSWRARLGMFVLTRQEQRSIAFIVLAVALGLWTKHYRHAHPREKPNEVLLAPASTTPAPMIRPARPR
ncbi:MAG: hypothetical protein ABI787_07885 [Spartobacteria bacterium]